METSKSKNHQYNLRKLPLQKTSYVKVLSLLFHHSLKRTQKKWRNPTNRIIQIKVSKLITL